MEISLMPFIAMLSVRGMGVAVRVSTSTLRASSLSFSFCDTPKRCSSSMISRPRSRNSTFFPSSLCVPIRISVSPRLTRLRISACSFGFLKRVSISTVTGKPRIRVSAVWKCCIARIVVGTRKATCLPPIIALKAALRATSVLPKPTSPQRSRFIGTGFIISDFISEIAWSWDSVSSYSKASSNCISRSQSSGKAKPGLRCLSAYRVIRLFAISFAAAFALAFVRCHSVPPILDSLTFPSLSLSPIYVPIISSLSQGTKSISVPAYFIVI